MSIVVSVGDPSGIGPELLAHLLTSEAEWLARGSFQLTGPPALWHQLGLKEQPGLQFCGRETQDPLPRPGRPCPLGAQIQRDGLLRAMDIMTSNPKSVLLTLPVNKSQLIKSGLNFLGHTDYFRSIFTNAVITMAFRSGSHWLALVTDHIPVSEVPTRLSAKNIVQAGAQLHKASGKPLVICGLNPHGGEDGLIGGEEAQLAAALDSLRAQAIPCRGFVAADSLFAHWDSDEAILALYHDQGLGPFKALFHGRSCQISLGMPYRRVSPDHGTAYDLAGTGRADAGSLRQALTVALKSTQDRAP